MRPLPTLLISVLTATATAQGPTNLSISKPIGETDAQRAVRATPQADAVASKRDAIVHVFVWVDKKGQPFKIERPSTGMIIDPTGLVLTHWDLVADLFDKDGKPVGHHSLKVKLMGGSEHKAEFIAKHEASGLALIRMDAGDKKLTFCELADSKQTVAGEPAAVVSFHEGKDLVVYGGIIVRANGRVRVGSHRLSRKDILLTDAAIQRQNHGGALLNANRRLLGICNASNVQREVQEATLHDLRKPSFGFVVAAHKVRKVFADVFKKQKLQNPTLLAAPKQTAAQTARRMEGPAAVLANIRKSIVGVHGGEGAVPEVGDTDPYATRRRSKLGSGTIIDSSGLVLTNDHLVRGANQVRVTLHDGRRCTAKVLKGNLSSNVALLKLDIPAGVKLQPIELGDSAAVKPGETVVGVGNPFGVALTPSVGILSASRGQKRVSLGKQEETGLWLQTDANLWDHNGGGPLVDMAGRMIGVVDGGRMDRLEVAAMQTIMRKQTMKLQTGLYFVPGVNRIRSAFRRQLDENAGTNQTVMKAPTATKAELALRNSRVAAVVQKTAGSLINVYVSWTSKQADAEDNPFAQSKPKIITNSLGSGVIITKDGLALTNWHVVDSATMPTGEERKDHTVHVRLRSGQKYQARVLSISREDDLALIQLVLPAGTKVDAVEFGDSDKLAEGETVVAIGNPHGQKNTATAGVITAKNQGIRIQGRWAKFKGLLQTDAAINAGNSGGALLDIHGKLVGINSAGGGGRKVSSYAIPVNYVRSKLFGTLLTAKKLRSIYIGLEFVDFEGKVAVSTMNRYGPATLAGVKNSDRLVALDGTRLTWAIGTWKELLKKNADKPLKLTIEREGKEKELTIKPFSAPTWAVFQQTGMVCSELAFRAKPDELRKACLAMHRKFTGDQESEPTTIPVGFVKVDRLHPSASDDGVEAKIGDVLLAVEVDTRGSTGVSKTLKPFRSVGKLQEFFNSHSNYKGLAFRCWVYRNGKIEVVPVTAKRLLY